MIVFIQKKSGKHTFCRNFKELSDFLLFQLDLLPRLCFYESKREDSDKSHNLGRLMFRLTFHESNGYVGEINAPLKYIKHEEWVNDPEYYDPVELKYDNETGEYTEESKAHFANNMRLASEKYVDKEALMYDSLPFIFSLSGMNGYLFFRTNISEKELTEILKDHEENLINILEKTAVLGKSGFEIFLKNQMLLSDSPFSQLETLLKEIAS